MIPYSPAASTVVVAAFQGSMKTLDLHHMIQPAGFFSVSTFVAYLKSLCARNSAITVSIHCRENNTLKATCDKYM